MHKYSFNKNKTKTISGRDHMKNTSKFHLHNFVSSEALAVVIALSLTPLAFSGSAQAQTVNVNSPDEIVVTGRLRGEAESLQDVPAAITVVTPGQLDAIGSVTIEDLEILSPNLIIDDNGSGAGAAGISIRGISFEDVEKSQEPTVGVVVDGVFSATNTGLLSNTFDFEQVEVLRGPQGTLFGRNTIAGVINIRRSRPTGEFGLKAEATIGSFGRQEFNGVLNFGLGENVALKLFGYDAQTDGFLNNVTTGRNAGARNSRNFGATMLFAPTDALEISLTAEQVELSGDNNAISLSSSNDLICLLPSVIGGAGGTDQCDRPNSGDSVYDVFSDGSNFYDYEAQSFSGTVNYDMGAFKLTSITAYSQSDQDSSQDFDATSVNFFAALRPETYDQFTQEIRVAGNFTDRLSGVIGGFYLENSVDLGGGTVFGPLFTSVALGFPPPGIELLVPAGTKQDLTSYAVFGDFDFALTDKLNLGFGARYSKDKKDFERVNVGTNKDSWNAFTPRVNLDYQLNDDVLLYGSYSRGFRSGGFNVRGDTPAAVAASFEPEDVDAFELGLKTSFADDRVTLNFAAFRSNYTDKQEAFIESIPSGQQTVSRNIAKATIDGLEVDMRAELSEYFTLTGSLGLLNARYKDYLARLSPTSPFVDVSDLPLRRSPDVTFSLSGAFDYPITENGDLNTSLTLASTSEYQSTLGSPYSPISTVSDPRGLIDEVTNVSASIGYTHEIANGREIYIRGFGRNLLNEQGAVAGIPVAGLFTFGVARAPREYGVTIGGKF